MLKDTFRIMGAYSGNILIASNYFGEIAGCPAVHTSLIQVSILDLYTEYDQATDTDSIIRLDLVPQEYNQIKGLLD